MTRFISLLALTLLIVSPLPAEETDSKSPETIQRLLHGDWRGQGPCDGNLSIQPDGTWTWKNIGPGGDRASGQWKLTWDALPPKLTLHIDEADAEESVGTEQVYRVTQLNQARFSFRIPDQEKGIRFRRVVE